jgi:hypothetical protein
MWLAVWNNDKNQTQAVRLAWIKDEASTVRFDARESVGGGVTRFSYRLHDASEAGPVESLSAYVIGDDGHLQLLSVYFDDAADAVKAQQLVDGVAARP